MDAEERFYNKRMGLISLNWTAKRVSVKGQILVKKHAKMHLSSSANTKMLKMKLKNRCKNGRQKTVSSREKGIRRREEGETTSSQRMISIQGNQEVSRKNLMKAEDDSPTHTRNSKNDNDDETKRMEDMRGKGGGRLKHRTVDGDVPLCLR